jgi:hypothetical protein
LAALQYITPQTVYYALSTVISCVCCAANDPMTRGRAEPVYENLIGNYGGKFTSAEFADLIRNNLTEWISE